MAVINGLQVRGGQVYEPALGVPTQAVGAPDGASVALVRAAFLVDATGEPISAGNPEPVQPQATGNSGALAVGVAAAAAASVNTGALPLFVAATVMVSVSAATTVTVYLRSAAGNWYPYTTWAPSAAAANAIPVTAPSTGLQVATSAAVTWTVEYQTAR